MRDTSDERLAAWLRHATVLQPPASGLPAGIARVRLSDADATSRMADAARVTVTGYDYTSLVVDVEMDVPGLVYWSDWDDGYWRARLDGQPAAVHRANLNFKAVAVPPGRHQIRFAYSPTPFLAAIVLFYAALAVAGAATIVLAVGRWAPGSAIAVSVSRA